MSKFFADVKAYSKELVSDESGIEFLEIAIGVALVAGLIAILIKLFTSIGNKVDESEQAVSNMDTNYNVGGQGSGTNNGP